MHACPAELNFAQHIIATNAGRAEKTAYIDGQGTMTYGQMAERIAKFAGLLKELGLRREERILLSMHDNNDWPVAFLGALYAGVVPVAVNTLLPAADYAYMMEHSRCQAAIVSSGLLPTLQEALGTARHEVNHVIVSRPEGALEPGFIELESRLQQATAIDAVPTKSGEIAFWLYSSGSTGQPKGVVHCHANLWHTAELYGKPVLGVREDDIVFSAAKLFFAYGLGNGLTFPLSVGATVVLMDERPTPAAVYKRLVDYKPTVFCGVPTLYASMLAYEDMPDRSEVAMRVCASAGEALPRDLGDRFTKQYGCYILDGIGSTEMLHIFVSNREDDLRYGTTGKPVPGYQVEIRDDEGRPVPPGTIGDLYIKGPSAALLYWNDRTRTCGTFLGDWVKSGDKYVCDEDGYYTYSGRSDDMIKVSGQYVSPIEVENILIQHTAVLEAAVIGATDKQGLVKTTAYVVLRSGNAACEAIEQELQAFVKSQLAPFKYPRSIFFVDELPKTATGKIQRFRLRQKEVH